MNIGLWNLEKPEVIYDVTFIYKRDREYFGAVERDILIGKQIYELNETQSKYDIAICFYKKYMLRDNFCEVLTNNFQKETFYRSYEIFIEALNNWDFLTAEHLLKKLIVIPEVDLGIFTFKSFLESSFKIMKCYSGILLKSTVVKHREPKLRSSYWFKDPIDDEDINWIVELTNKMKFKESQNFESVFAYKKIVDNLKTQDPGKRLSFIIAYYYGLSCIWFKKENYGFSVLCSFKALEAYLTYLGVLSDLFNIGKNSLRLKVEDNSLPFLMNIRNQLVTDKNYVFDKEFVPFIYEINNSRNTLKYTHGIYEASRDEANGFNNTLKKNINEERSISEIIKLSESFSKIPVVNKVELFECDDDYSRYFSEYTI